MVGSSRLLAGWLLGAALLGPAAHAQGGDIQKRIQACGMDIACLNRVAQEAMKGLPSMPTGMPTGPAAAEAYRGPGTVVDAWDHTKPATSVGPDPENPVPNPLHQVTMMPASWLQLYQDALVQCGDDVRCFVREQAVSLRYVQQVCGTDMFQEATTVCHLAAQMEVQAEQAIASQRLWSQGIEFPEMQTAPAPAPGPARSDPARAPAGRDSVRFLPQVTKARVRQIMDRYDAELKVRVPQSTREALAAEAPRYPTSAPPDTPPFVSVEHEEDGGVRFEVRPTRRDWAFALAGFMLTDAALAAPPGQTKALLDAAFWCAIQAARLQWAPSHLVSLGFHLNLRGRFEEARDVLTHARGLDPSNAAVDNNLAFSMAGLGKRPQAEALQQSATRKDPDNVHIRRRLAAMLEGDRPRRGRKPRGGDFGEQYFRLTRRHNLRQYRAGKAWFRARERARDQIDGADPPVPGPHQTYRTRLKAIDAEYQGCTAAAPEIPYGCPPAAGPNHPRCKDAASPKEVARATHNRNAYLCACSATRIKAEAVELGEFLVDAAELWTRYEKTWAGPLQNLPERWGRDIRAVNAQYQGTSMTHPTEGPFTGWIEEFREDSEEFWESDLPGLVERWMVLKKKAQDLKGCPVMLPPLQKRPEKPKIEPKKVKVYKLGFGPISWTLGMDGSFRVKVDVPGIGKLEYTRNAQTDGHKLTGGVGPIEGSLEYNHAPAPGAPRFKATVTGNLNVLDELRGRARVPGRLGNASYELEGKLNLSWDTSGGWDMTASGENQSRWGTSTSERVATPGLAHLN